MDNNQLKDALFDFLELVRKELKLFEESLTKKQREETGSLLKWSVKDVFSHLVFWGNHFNSQIRKAESGDEVPQVGDYLDQVNDGVLIEHMAQPFSEALEEFDKSYQESTSILKAYTANELNDKEKFQYLEGRTLVDRALGTFGGHIMYHISDFYIQNEQAEKAVDLQEKITGRLRNFPTWEANAIYNLACFYAQIDKKEKAVANLKTAFLTRPDLIEWSKNDSDLDSLRENLDFKALFPTS